MLFYDLKCRGLFVQNAIFNPEILFVQISVHKIILRNIHLFVMKMIIPENILSRDDYC